MNVAISAKDPDEKAEIDERFGRCPYFVIVDTKEMDFECMENPHSREAHGVGPQVVQTLSDMEVDTVISGNIGPNAYRTLNSADIEVYKGSGEVEEAVKKLEKGELNQLDDETVQGHFGEGKP